MGFFLVFLGYITDLQGRYHKIPPQPEQWSGPVVQRLTGYVGASSCQGQDSGFGAGAVTRRFGGCHSAPPAPPQPRRCTQSYPQQWGQRLIPRWPISDSVGAPDSSHRQPNLSPLEWEFSDLCLQIAHLQQCQSRNAVSVGTIFPA